MTSLSGEAMDAVYFAWSDEPGDGNNVGVDAEPSFGARSGGMRASLYNAMTIEGTKMLVDFMADFARKNG